MTTTLLSFQHSKDNKICFKTKMIKENVFNVQIFANYSYFKINNY